MTKLPRLTGKEIVGALGRAGFLASRIKGSHHYLPHADGRVTVVPVHSGETTGPGLMSKILRDCEMSRDDFEALL